MSVCLGCYIIACIKLSQTISDNGYVSSVSDFPVAYGMRSPQLMRTSSIICDQIQTAGENDVKILVPPTDDMPPQQCSDLVCCRLWNRQLPSNICSRCGKPISKLHFISVTVYPA